MAQLQLTAVLDGGEVVLPLSLDASANVEALAQQVYALSGLPPSQMQLACNGRLLEPRHQPLSSLGVNSGGAFPSHAPTPAPLEPLLAHTCLSQTWCW